MHCHDKFFQQHTKRFLHLPFMTAVVFHHNKKPKLNITSDKDRCKEVECAPWFQKFEGYRINYHHLSLAEKMAA